MRKRMFTLLCVCAAMTFSVPASATTAEVVVEAQIDVQVKYTEEDQENSTALGDAAPVRLPDGTEVTVQEAGEADADVRASVILVTEEDAPAMSYVTGVMEEHGKDVYAFYVLFYQDGKEVTPSSPVTLTVTAPDGYEDIALYSFTGDGAKPVKVADAAENGVWTLTLSDSCYFAAAKPGSGGDETEQPGPGGDETEQPGPGGDETEQPGPGGDETEQPGTETEQPGTETEQPGTETEQPGTETEQPGTETEQPGTETEQPGTETEQPDTESERKPAETLKPEESDNNTTAAAAQTGDDSPIAGWLFAMLAAGGGILLLGLGKKKTGDQSGNQ